MTVPEETCTSTPVVVEVFGLSVSGGRLYWRVRRAPLSGALHPDTLARALAQADDELDVGVVLHSTSWRHTRTEMIVTYALFPDLRPGDEVRLLEQHLVSGPGPLHPSPPSVGDGHVAAHAVRHLADLAADRDPHVTACRRLRPFDWQLLAEHARQVHVDLVTDHRDRRDTPLEKQPAVPEPDGVAS